MHFRKVKDRSCKRSIFIVSEGTNTEPQYFSSGYFNPTNCIKKVYFSKKTNSSPKGVLKKALSLERGRDFGSEDVIWIVIDRDNWTNEQFKEVIEWQNDRRHVAISNPSFEYWLLLHFENASIKSPQDCYRKLEKYIPYYNKNLDIRKFTLSMIKSAVSRAKERHQNVEEECINFYGSTVYKLVEVLINEI